MADSGVGNSSTSENGQLQSGDNRTRNEEESEKKPDDDKSDTQSAVNSDKKSDGDGSPKTTNSNSVSTASATPAATSSLFSFCRSEGSRLNHSSSPLRPSVLGGCSSSSSSSSTTQFGSASICSPMLSSSPNSFPRNLFAKSSLSCLRPSENRSPVFQKPVLRPSQLASPSLAESPLTTSRSPNPFVLNPPKLANPFAKANESSHEPVKLNADGDNSVAKQEDKPVISSSKTVDNNVATSPAAGQQPPQLQQQACSKTPTTSVAFVPLTSTPGSTTSSTPIRLPATSSVTPVATSSATPGGFVFGQNLHERVIVEPGAPEASSSSSDGMTASSVHNDVGTSSTATAATNGTSTEMLFTSVIKKELPDKTSEGDAAGVDDSKGKKSLTESAREYEESRAVKRKYEEVTVVTGEEEENNILQMDCKLFVYDGSKFNYSEGVHGSLRVNDPPVTAKKVTQSRVIVRMSGTLRVLMNTKIWAGMKIEKPNRKIVRMTAMDSIGQIKVFLISSSPSESDMLYRVLESRIKLQKELTGACRNGSVEDADKTEGGQ